MYDKDKILSHFIGQIGWRNDEGYLQDMVTSTSGRFYNDEHPMITMENLKMIAALYEDWEFQTLSDELVEGILLQVRDKTYITLKKTTGFGDDGTTDLDHQDDEMFAKIDLFTEWLRRRTNSGILKAVDDWFIEQQQVVSLLSDLDPFSYKEKQVEPIGQLRLQTLRKGVSVHISEVSIWLGTEDQTFDLTLTDMYGGTETVEVAYAKGRQEISVDWDLKPNSIYTISLDGASGNCYVYDNNFENKYVKIEGFDGEDSVNYNNGFGLKAEIGCDLTDFVIRNDKRFLGLIVMSVAIRLIRELIYNANNRINRNASNINIAELRYELEGSEYKHGLAKTYGKFMKSLKLETNGLHKDCLPCKKTGVKYGTIK